MRQMFPHSVAEADPTSLIQSTIGSHRDRPWITANMVMSADGAYSVEGRSGGLSSTADKEVFRALRNLADVILVGAETARTERYRRPNPAPETQVLRVDRGQAPYPLLAVVSGSGNFPPDQPFLTGDGPDPLVLVPTKPLGEVRDGIEYRVIGSSEDTGVNATAIVDELTNPNCNIVLCEGGPSLLGQLVRARLLDQLFLTLAPRLAAGTHTGLLGRIDPVDAGLNLKGVLEEDGFLMLNYHVTY